MNGIKSFMNDYISHIPNKLQTHGHVDRVLDSRLESLGFNPQCWSCVEVLGKFRILHCLSLSSCNGNLVHRSKVESIDAGCIGTYLARI